MDSYNYLNVQVLATIPSSTNKVGSTCSPLHSILSTKNEGQLVYVHALDSSVLWSLYNFTKSKAEMEMVWMNKINGNTPHRDFNNVMIGEYESLPYEGYDREAHQLQIASTASFFITLGHGSPPNSSGSTVIAQPA